jgi:hypothetical protein
LPVASRFWLAAPILAGPILAGLAPLAHAGEPPRPVCGRNEVLDVVADDIAQRGIDAVILPGSVGQIPTALSDTVRCAVRLQTTVFDTNRFGAVPQVRLLVLDYTVHAGRNGLFVDVAGDPR